MKNDTFFLVTRQPIKNGMGFTITETKKEGIENVLSSIMLDTYITMVITVETEERSTTINSEQAEVLLKSLEKMGVDAIKEIKKTIKFIESLIPIQTTELKKLFKSVEYDEEFLEDFMKSYERSKKKFALNWTEDPSTRVRPYFLGISYYKELIDQVSNNLIMSFQEKQTIKEKLDHSLRHAAQTSVTDKLIAWASLQNKKRQEESNKDTEREKEESPTARSAKEEEGQTT